MQKKHYIFLGALFLLILSLGAISSFQCYDLEYIPDYAVCDGSEDCIGGEDEYGCGPPPCTPDCSGRECGSDGCGGSCGYCGADYECFSGLCIFSCIPDCSGKECGSDGCGGSCGYCGGWTPYCSSGKCVECTDNVHCGDSSSTPYCRSGKCVECSINSHCGSWEECVSNKCVSTCTPSCPLGAECAYWGDGCGGLIWCGAITTSCTVKFGTCTSTGTKTCATVQNPIPGVTAGYYGSCEGFTDPTIDNCVGKECGDDGCGGVCGTCASDKKCVSGQCEPTCTVTDTCVSKECYLGNSWCVNNCGNLNHLDDTCDGSKLYCDDTFGDCVACTEDIHCPDGECVGGVCLPFCSDTCSSSGYECGWQIICGKNEYCGGCSGSTPYCSYNTCVECLSTFDCDGSETRNSGCQRREEYCLFGTCIWGSWTNINEDKICSTKDFCSGDGYYSGKRCDSGTCGDAYGYKACPDASCFSDGDGTYSQKSDSICSSASCSSQSTSSCSNKYACSGIISRENGDTCTSPGTCTHNNQCAEGYVCIEGNCGEEIVKFCGDGIVNQLWEKCDDGNNENGDGCSSECQIEYIECCDDLDCGTDYCIGEPNYCFLGDVYQKYMVYTCNNPGGFNSYCSNEIIPILIEECDYGCEDGACLDKPVEPVCGDGVVNQLWEECDDGNVVSGDGCSSECEIEVPECDFNSDCGTDYCIGEPNYCFLGDVYQKYMVYTCNNPGGFNSYCSDEIVPILIEECDYGCEGGECLDEPIDDPVCGDGIIDAGEFCDDGVNNGEEGYCNSNCSGLTTYCGDSICNNNETCLTCPEDCGKCPSPPPSNGNGGGGGGGSNGGESSFFESSPIVTTKTGPMEIISFEEQEIIEPKVTGGVISFAKSGSIGLIFAILILIAGIGIIALKKKSPKKEK